jgi:hypothetical protein
MASEPEGRTAMTHAITVIRAILWYYGTAVLLGIWLGCGTAVVLGIRDGNYYSFGVGIVLLATLHMAVVWVLRHLWPFRQVVPRPGIGSKLKSLLKNTEGSLLGRQLRPPAGMRKGSVSGVAYTARRRWLRS